MSKQWEQALWLLDTYEVHSKGFKPDIVTYEAVIQAMIGAGCAPRAVHIYRRVVAEGLLRPWVTPTMLDMHGMPQHTAMVAVHEAVDSHLRSPKTLQLVVGRGH
eukprot:CAMPEP_0171143144 /NCGR_PEP_ID=MMETSP0766_2-20121228/143812_1 /TAXON_ID=439317 /ORGANISM="Gambierdiscus australes, Strain CAWD 149" /LENGTH=103 /DNA_ID=CAMNT_0011606961 /DNA_START=36 /DNA_END=344 /DNA_ORIENTATION=+